jgi:hypothetical protein
MNSGCSMSRSSSSKSSGSSNSHNWNMHQSSRPHRPRHAFVQPLQLRPLSSLSSFSNHAHAHAQQRRASTGDTLGSGSTNSLDSRNWFHFAGALGGPELDAHCLDHMSLNTEDSGIHTDSALTLSLSSASGQAPLGDDIIGGACDQSYETGKTIKIGENRSNSSSRSSSSSSSGGGNSPRGHNQCDVGSSSRSPSYTADSTPQSPPPFHRRMAWQMSTPSAAVWADTSAAVPMETAHTAAAAAAHRRSEEMFGFPGPSASGTHGAPSGAVESKPTHSGRS